MDDEHPPGQALPKDARIITGAILVLLALALIIGGRCAFGSQRGALEDQAAWFARHHQDGRTVEETIAAVKQAGGPDLKRQDFSEAGDDPPCESWWAYGPIGHGERLVILRDRTVIWCDTDRNGVPVIKDAKDDGER